MVFAVSYVCWTKIKLVDLRVLETSMHANMLDERGTIAWTGYCSF